MSVCIVSDMVGGTSVMESVGVERARCPKWSAEVEFFFFACASEGGMGDMGDMGVGVEGV